MGSPWVNGRFTFDMSDSVLFKKDADNYIDTVGIQQLNTIGDISYLDIFLGDGNSVEFHYHPNASELTYCITGAIEVGWINPNNNEWQTFIVKPGDVISIPQGFWHYLIATEDDTHVLAGFDTNNLQTIFGSDIFLHTPAEALADVYCLDEELLEETFSPIKDTVIIGPPSDCDCDEEQSMTGGESAETNQDQRHEHWLGIDKKQERREHSDDQRNDRMKASPAREQHKVMIMSQPLPREKNNNRMEEMVMPEYSLPLGTSNNSNNVKREMSRNKNQRMMMEDKAMRMPELRPQQRAAREMEPVKYGGTVTREMNICEDCMRHFEK